mmetsp:Transcript_108924/g.347749  ORF Transcript_108924/g.347749 Transcript_108924/m.347749 type:complete len:381 (-) Transcript_108924:62-1204(-)
MGCGASATGRITHGAGKTVSTDVERPVEAAGEGSYEVIVWGASGLECSDVVGGCGQYFVVRFGCEGTPWNEIPRFTGRRGPSVQGASEPKWDSGFLVNLLDIQDPVLNIRICDKGIFTADSSIGFVSTSVASLVNAAAPVTLNLGEGEGKVTISMGAPGLLRDNNIDNRVYFPKLAPVGALKTVQAKDVTGGFPLRTGTAPLPLALRGVFWLSDQKDSSAMMTFGGPSNDGGACSTGQLMDDRCKIRCGGDRSWAEDGKAPTNNHDKLDLIYHFAFDDASNPTKGQIYPEWAALSSIAMSIEHLMDFEMELISDEAYPGSVVWRRDTAFAGMNAKSVEYMVVQIIDESGQRIQPAFSKFLGYQESSERSEPGVLYYRGIQ